MTGRERPSVEERLCVAVSITQAFILSQDSNASGRAEWGTSYLPTSSLEEVVRLLLGVMDELERA